MDSYIQSLVMWMTDSSEWDAKLNKPKTTDTKINSEQTPTE